MGKVPVTWGSKVPVCPTFLMPNNLAKDFMNLIKILEIMVKLLHIKSLNSFFVGTTSNLCDPVRTCDFLYILNVFFTP